MKILDIEYVIRYYFTADEKNKKDSMPEEL